MATSPEDVAHLLRRSGFVASPARVAALVPLDWAEVVEAVLDTSVAPPEDHPAVLLRDDGPESWKQHHAHLQWWFDRCVSTPTPLVEKMLLFWHGHFAVGWTKVYHLPAMRELSSLYRAGALGRIEPLAQQMAIAPAMLWYLDNFENTKRSPNLNFARELMELFLLGVGNYTEDDVLASARAWTGHSAVATPVLEYRFLAEHHDADPKTFFGTTRNWDGPDIITEIVHNPATRPVVARFFARKLWEFFAYQNPSTSVVDDIAAALLGSDLEIRAALRAIFLHPEFRSETARRGLVRSPVEYVVVALTATGLSAADAHPERSLEAMGQDPFDPPNVSGWRPNGYWVNTSAFNGRAMFARSVSWLATRNGMWADLAAGTAADAISAAEAAFATSFSDVTRAALATWFDRQRVSTGTWTMPENFMTLVLLAPELHTA